MKNVSLRVLLFVWTLASLSACKKEEKTDVPLGYTISIVGGNNHSEESGRMSTSPIIVQINKDGKPIPFTEVLADFVYDAGNCTLFKDYLYFPLRAKYVSNADGTVSLYWHTGNKIGTQKTTIILRDTKTWKTICSTEATLQITENSEGFTPTCFLNYWGSMTHAGNGQFYWLKSGEVYWTYDAGGTWLVNGGFSLTNQSATLNDKYFWIHPLCDYHLPSNQIIYMCEKKLYKTVNQHPYNWVEICDANSYLGTTQNNDWIVDASFGIVKLSLDNEGNHQLKYWGSISSPVGFVQSAQSTKCYINTIDGRLYSANDVLDSFVKVNTPVVCDYLYKDGNQLLAFSATDVYQLVDGSLTSLGAINIPVGFKVFKVVKHNGIYYVEARSNLNTPQALLFTGSSLTSLTPSSFKLCADIDIYGGGENLHITSDNYLMLHNESGYYSIKKP